MITVTFDSLAASAEPSCSCCSPATCEKERLRLTFSICTVAMSTEQIQEHRLLLPDRNPIELSHLSKPELKALATFVGVNCVGANETALVNSLTDHIHVARPQRWTLRDLPVSCPWACMPGCRVIPETLADEQETPVDREASKSSVRAHCREVLQRGVTACCAQMVDTCICLVEFVLTCRTSPLC